MPVICVPLYQGQKSWMWIPAEIPAASESLIATEAASLAHHGPAILGTSLHYVLLSLIVVKCFCLPSGTKLDGQMTTADPIGALTRRLARLEVIIQDTDDVEGMSNDVRKLQLAIGDFVSASDVVRTWIASPAVQEYVHRADLPVDATSMSSASLQTEEKVNLILASKDQTTQFLHDLDQLQLHTRALLPQTQPILESLTAGYSTSNQIWQLRKRLLDMTVELHHLTQWSLALCQYWGQLMTAWNSKCADWEERMIRAQKQVIRIEHARR